MRRHAYDALDRIRWSGTRTTRLPLRKRRVNRITQSKRPAASGRLRLEVAGCATAVIAVSRRVKLCADMSSKLSKSTESKMAMSICQCDAIVHTDRLLGAATTSFDDTLRVHLQEAYLLFNRR